MRSFDLFPGFFGKLASLVAAWFHRSDFMCGECEQWQRCGRPPSNECIVKAQQIARKEGRT